MPYGYDQGNPFGDPNKFTRSTQEAEVDRFNDWMRSQPWWQQIRGTGQGDFTDQQRSQIVQAAQREGIRVPKDFQIDQGGNFNQKGRTKRNLAIAGIAGGAALGGLGIAGLGPLGALGGGGAAAGAGGGGAAAGGSLAAGEGLPWGIGGAASMLPGAAGAGAAGLGAIEGGAFGMPASAAGAMPGASAVPGMGDLVGTVGSAAGAARGAGKGAGGLLGGASDWLGPALGAGAALVGSKITDGQNQNMPPQLMELLQEAIRRQQYQTPLFNATTEAAYAGLPNYAKKDGK